MEIFLLWADEIDDALGALRHLLPRLLSLAGALLLFAATGFLMLHASYTVAGVIGCVAICGLIIAFERRLHARPRTERVPLAAMLQRQFRRVGRSGS